MDLAVYDDNGTHVNFVHAHSNFISKIDPQHSHAAINYAWDERMGTE